MNFSSQPSAENYCNVQAVQLGLDPVGTAYDFDDAFIIEMPLPWRKSLYERDGPLPHALLDLYDVWSAEYEAGKPYHHNSMLVAPDESAEQVEQDERRTVIFYERPIHPFAYFMKTEYRVPVEEIGQILWARYMQPEQMRQFERYRRAEFDRVRDILVCTHGSVDVACAKFGYPLYQMLRRTYHDEPEIRVCARQPLWRPRLCTHADRHAGWTLLGLCWRAAGGANRRPPRRCRCPQRPLPRLGRNLGWLDAGSGTRHLAASRLGVVQLCQERTRNRARHKYGRTELG